MLIQWWFLNCNKKHFQVFTCSFVFWSRHRNFPRKQLTNVIRQASCWFIFFCWVVIFITVRVQRFSTFLSVSPMHSSLQEHLFTLYHTRRIWVFAFDFKHWFYLSCYSFYCNSVRSIDKCLEFFNKMFGSIFVFFTVWYFN